MRLQTKTLVSICGPDAAAPFLGRLAAELESRGIENLLHFGSLAALAATPRWRETKVLVPYAVTCGAAEIEAAPSLRAIVVPSLGYEGIDVDAASKHRVLVTNGQVDENFDTVAEAAILFMLMALYDIHETERRLREGTRCSGPPRATMMRGKTVGIIGHGNIARRVIRRLANWDVNILVHTRSRHDPIDGDLSFVDLDTLLRRSDIVLPLVSLNASTHHLLNRERLLLMCEGAILVNLSRGAVVDETALGDPVISSRLHAIASDVFETEPLPIDSPLRHLPHAILTPHEVCHTRENLEALFQKALQSVLDAVAGNLPDATLNPEIEGDWLRGD